MTIASFQSRVRAGKLNTVQGGEHAVENFKSNLNSRSLRNICMSLDDSSTPLFIMESVTALVFPFIFVIILWDHDLPYTTFL